MPAQRPRASFEPIRPDIDINQLVESTPNFSFVDRISCGMIDKQGMQAFEKLVLLHVIIGGKPLVIDGFEERLDPWTFSPKWLRDNIGEKVESARNLTAKENLPLTMGHYLRNMGKLTNQFFDRNNPKAYKEKNRQRVYLKDIDCPDVWQDKLKEHIPGVLFYLNGSTGDVGGLGALPDTTGGKKPGRGIARAGDLMSSLPADMRAENLMCYVGHEGTYTPAHREMCASLGQNIMVEASTNIGEDGSTEKPGSSVWFMTESKDRHIVSEYWLSVLGHDIEVEDHFAQTVAWKKAPFNVYVVEQRPGDFILIPPLAPHQVWNRGTRTMKVAWNRTTAETLEMALNEALPRSRVVCRDEQYKNKAIVYYTLQKYANLLSLAQTHAAQMPPDAAQQFMYSSSGKVKQLTKDFKKLFGLYKQILLSEMFNPDDKDAPKLMQYLPFDSNVTCAYCRGNVFNRFLTCPSCKDLLGHAEDEGEGDPYDVCLDCYAMGRSCGCISNLKWVEQFRWKELAGKYETWRGLIITLDGGQVTSKTPSTLVEERKRLDRKTLAEVCKEQLKRRPWKDVHKPAEKTPETDDEEIVVGDDGTVKKITKKKSKTWLKNNSSCHVCNNRHENWKMAFCSQCERGWCYGSLFRGWDKMPLEIMETSNWECPHCLGICFAGGCRREGKSKPYEPKGTLLGHDTKKVADVRSVEALVDFSVSNLNWLKDDATENMTDSKRVKRARAEAQLAKDNATLDEDEDGEDDDAQDQTVDETQVDYETTPVDPTIDPALESGGDLERREGEDEDAYFARRLQQANSTLPPVAAAPFAHDGYAPVAPMSGYGAPPEMYPQPGHSGYAYPGYARPSSVTPMDEVQDEGIRPFKRTREAENGDDEDISMSKAPKAKKPRMAAAGFRSTDLADEVQPTKSKNEVQRQFEKEKERKALDKAKTEGRFIMLQAALRGKKRVVKFKLTGARLAQAIVQQAAKAAVSNGDANGDHAVIDTDVQAQDQPNEEDALLVSDIPQKKVPRDERSYVERREREGYVVTGGTKKALIPVERDENYGYREKGAPSGGKRVVEKREARKPAVDYEEVDIGSDDDDDGDTAYSTKRKEPAQSDRRRTLPGYLRNRNPQEGPSNGAPEEQRDRPTKKSRVSLSAANGGNTQVAGKRPLLKPSAQASDNTRDDHDDEMDDVFDHAMSADFLADNHTVTNGKQSNGLPQGRPSSRPPGRPTETEELNRLAKLQALEMVTGSNESFARPNGTKGKATKPGGPVTISMAEVLSDDDDDDDSDDGIDSIPARKAAVGGASR